MVHGTLAVHVSCHCIIGTSIHTCFKSRNSYSSLRQVVGVVRPFLAAYKGEFQASRSIKGEVRGWAVGVA